MLGCAGAGILDPSMTEVELRRIFRSLRDAYGPQAWWPAESAFEVVVGAILTQRTTWTNANRAIDGLRSADLWSFPAIRSASEDALADAIRSAGCYRQKTATLRAFADAIVGRAGGDLAAFLALPTKALRRELLAIRGVGPETADAILLYAAGRPSFVVDAYTRRLFERLGTLDGREKYAAVRDRLMAALPPDLALYNEFHALIVRHGKTHCRAAPRCEGCPLWEGCPAGLRSNGDAR